MRKKDRQDLHECIDSYIDLMIERGEDNFKFLINISKKVFINIQAEGYKKQYHKKALKRLTSKGKSALMKLTT